MMDRPSTIETGKEDSFIVFNVTIAHVLKQKRKGEK